MYRIQVLYNGEWRTADSTKDRGEAERLKRFYKSINDTEYVRIIKDNNK